MTTKDDTHGCVMLLCTELMTDADEDDMDNITEAFICALATILRIRSRHDTTMLAENAKVMQAEFTDFISNVVSEFQPPPSTIQ
jgi:hypothetical protein